MEKSTAQETSKKYLYGFTIQGIQRYIFNTNKLTDIIGASEIVENICTKFFENNYPGFKEDELRQAAAGSISYIFKEKEDAKSFYSEFPSKVTEEAGNIAFSQAIIEVEGELTADHLREIAKKLRVQRNRPANNEGCGTMTTKVNRRTGEPAFEKIRENDFIDYTSKCKTLRSTAKRLLEKIDIDKKWIFPTEFSQITNAKSKNYLAIIHADGNGLGKAIQKIIKQSKPENAISDLKQFSKDIEGATIAAFKWAFENVVVKMQDVEKNGQILPIRPVILGGDDITLIIRADLAIDFTYEYLKAFEEKTKSFLKVNKIDGLNGLTATAGIVFIKEKYPFHYGAHLAESICSIAKNESERAYSGLKFYRVQDSFVNSYKSIIEKELTIDSNFNFNKKTYTLSEIEELKKQLKFLKGEDVPAGPLRKLLSIIYEDKTKAQFHLDRTLSVNKAFKNTILKTNINDNKHLYDLITLNSLTTEN